MRISNRFKKVSLIFDRDELLSVEAISAGLVEILTNTSSSRTITFPHHSAVVGSELFAPGEVHEILFVNNGIENLELLANTELVDFIKGDTTVLAGGFRLVKIYVSYDTGKLGIFCI